MSSSIIERRIRWAGTLIAVGLAIQLLTLLGTRPLAFVAFLAIGCPLVGIGVLIYLYSLVTHEPVPPPSASTAGAKPR